MTRKLHIDLEDLDLRKIRKELKTLERVMSSETVVQIKSYFTDGNKICGTCILWCQICKAIYPKIKGGTGMDSCPCDVYYKKDVAHVAEYLLRKI